MGEATGATFGASVGVEIVTASGVVTGRKAGCGPIVDTTGTPLNASVGVDIGTAKEGASGAVATVGCGITSKTGAEVLGETPGGDATGDTGGLFDMMGESAVGTKSIGAAGVRIGSVVTVSTISSNG